MAIPKLDTLGRILDEPYVNWYILVEDTELERLKSDDRHYYVFTVKYNLPVPKLGDNLEYRCQNIGYDSYYLSWTDVERAFEKLEVEWLENEEALFGHRYYDKNNPDN